MKRLVEAAICVTLVTIVGQSASAQSWQPPTESQRCPSKWGAGDQRGSGNHMKPETVLRAARLIKTGEVFELGRVLSNTMPLFGELVNPLIERPGKAMALETPGCFSARSLIWRMTASVRSNEAADGSCVKAIRYCLSCVGTKPLGILLNEKPVNASRPT